MLDWQSLAEEKLDFRCLMSLQTIVSVVSLQMIVSVVSLQIKFSPQILPLGSPNPRGERLVFGWHIALPESFRDYSSNIVSVTRLLLVEQALFGVTMSMTARKSRYPESITSAASRTRNTGYWVPQRIIFRSNYGQPDLVQPLFHPLRKTSSLLDPIGSIGLLFIAISSHTRIPRASVCEQQC